ncbi:MAG: peptide ABC transporter substrate-binding protein [Alphaproteobacteria bacterium]|nr:peptide ABC transporter substrate-binding protein [Alphaproteobacteria bacterium]
MPRVILLAFGFVWFAQAATAAPMVLHRGNTAEPETLDPQKTYIDQTGNIVLDLFVGLTTYDAASNPIPGAAVSWTVSPDGLTYTFKLRPHQWSDGAPVTAEDVALGVSRALDPKTASQLANLGFCIKNAVPVNAGKMPLDKLGVRVVDKATIEIKVENPCPTLIAALAEPPFTAVPAHTLKKHGDAWAKPGNMVSNGAYTLAEWRPNDRVRIVKNKRFYDAANVAIDEVIYFPIEDDAAALKRLRAGEIDLNIRVSPGDVAWLRANMPGVLRATPASSVADLAVNHTSKKFKDMRVRRALALAIDRETIGKSIAKLDQKPAYGVVPPMGRGYANRRFDFATMKLSDRQAEARRLLATAGYGPANPLTFTLRQRVGVAHQRAAIAMQNDWAKIGVKVDILTSELKSHYAAMNVADFDIGAVGLAWPADPEYFLSDLLPTAGTNYGRYASDAYVTKLRQGQAEVDVAKRFALFAEAEAVALADVAMIPLYFETTRNIVATHVKGFVDNPRDFHPTRFMRVEKKTPR